MNESSVDPGFYSTPKNILGPVHQKESILDFDNFSGTLTDKWTLVGTPLCDYACSGNALTVNHTGVANEGFRAYLTAAESDFGFNNIRKYFRVRVMSTDVSTASFGIWIHGSKYYIPGGSTGYRVYFQATEKWA